MYTQTALLHYALFHLHFLVFLIFFFFSRIQCVLDTMLVSKTRVKTQEKRETNVKKRESNARTVFLYNTMHWVKT